jgi:hypothetical protein
MATRAMLAALAVSAVLAARPAAAQLVLGSPDEPPRLELGAGAFDVTPDRKVSKVDNLILHPGNGTAGDLSAEYHFGDIGWWFFSPFVGLEATTKGATFGYFGFGTDLYFTPHWVLTPNAAAGFFQQGTGTRLGSWFEFRTGAEIDYKFDNLTRLGIAFHHVSNAGLTGVNPGEDSVTLVYSIPLNW